MLRDGAKLIPRSQANERVTVVQSGIDARHLKVTFEIYWSFVNCTT